MSRSLAIEQTFDVDDWGEFFEFILSEGEASCKKLTVRGQVHGYQASAVPFGYPILCEKTSKVVIDTI